MARPQPLVRVIRGNEHTLTMLGRFPPYDFVDPEVPGVAAGVPVIDEGLLERYVSPWTDMVFHPLELARREPAHACCTCRRRRRARRPKAPVISRRWASSCGYTASSPNGCGSSGTGATAASCAPASRPSAATCSRPRARRSPPRACCGRRLAEGLAHGDRGLRRPRGGAGRRLGRGSGGMTTPYDGLPGHRYWRASSLGAGARAVRVSGARDASSPSRRKTSSRPRARASLSISRGSWPRAGGASSPSRRGTRSSPRMRRSAMASSPRASATPCSRAPPARAARAGAGRARAGARFRPPRRRSLGWTSCAPRALPAGFASQAHALADRDFHLTAVRRMWSSRWACSSSRSASRKPGRTRREATPTRSCSRGPWRAP